MAHSVLMILLSASTASIFFVLTPFPFTLFPPKLDPLPLNASQLAAAASLLPPGTGVLLPLPLASTSCFLLVSITNLSFIEGAEAAPRGLYSGST